MQFSISVRSCRAFCLLSFHPPATPFPYTTLFRSQGRTLGIQFGSRVACVPTVCPHFHATPEAPRGFRCRSEEHTSELQSRQYLVCRLLLEKINDLLINNAITLTIDTYCLCSPSH